ncbi:MAG: DegT/DnrJ/EryC1/StrS aminotransferase family protein [Pseudomonadota bacterium]
MSDPLNQWPTWPSYDEEQVLAVSNVLRSGKVNYWTGKEGRNFEKQFAEYTGTQFGIAVSNGSVSLDMALEVLGVGPGDDVIVTPRSFVISASAVLRRGARPVFADIDRDSQNITPASVERMLTPQTKAIIAVHLAGWPCDMDGLIALCSSRGIHIIEDCAQAHGAEFRGKKVGSMGVLGSFSFCTDKIMTTGGEGGVITLNDADLYQALWSLKDHGKSQSKSEQPGEPGLFKFMIEGVGSNYRMTEMQSSMARVQLGHLEDWVAKRRQFAAQLNQGFSSVAGLRLTLPPDDIKHAYYKFYAFVDAPRLKAGWDRNRILVELIERGVPVGSGSCSEIYQEHAFQSMGLAPEKPLSVAHELGQTSIMFQVHPTLTTEHIARVIEETIDVMKRATK